MKSQIQFKIYQPKNNEIKMVNLEENRNRAQS